MLTAKLQYQNTTTQDIFTELDKARKTWEPSDLSNENTTSNNEIHTVMCRITAVALELELPVGAFIRAAIERKDEIPATAINGLINNIKDEETHELAFKKISRIFTPNIDDRTTASKFRKAILHAKHHPLSKARDLETICFLPLQGFMRVYGSEELERTVIDISHDEFRHVNYNWELSIILNLIRDIDFEATCLQVVNWCLQPLNIETREKWLQITRDMQDYGQSVDLQTMLNYGVHRAPFELGNDKY